MPEFDDWIEQQDPNKIHLWREAMAQLRQLHTDIWNGVRFFLTVSGILIAAIAALWRFELEPLRLTATLVLIWAGITITVFAILILDKHRNRYVHMLLRKTLIEYELGFFDQEIAETIEVAFPWSVPAEYVEDVARTHKSGYVSNRFVPAL